MAVRSLVGGIALLVAVGVSAAGCSSNTGSEDDQNRDAGADASASATTANPDGAIAPTLPAPSAATELPPVTPTPSAKPDKKANGQKVPKAPDVPMPNVTGNGDPDYLAKPADAAAAAGKGPSLESLAKAKGYEVVRMGPYKQETPGGVTYQTQYYLGKNGTQKGTLVIAAGSDFGGAIPDDQIKAFKEYGSAENALGGQVITYRVGDYYYAQGYFDRRMVTVASYSKQDFDALKSFMRATS